VKYSDIPCVNCGGKTTKHDRGWLLVCMGKCALVHTNYKLPNTNVFHCKNCNKKTSTWGNDVPAKIHMTSLNRCNTNNPQHKWYVHSCL